jgi:hypothetical protein
MLLQERYCLLACKCVFECLQMYRSAGRHSAGTCFERGFVQLRWMIQHTAQQQATPRSSTPLFERHFKTHPERS